MFLLSNMPEALEQKSSIYQAVNELQNIENLNIHTNN